MQPWGQQRFNKLADARLGGMMTHIWDLFPSHPLDHVMYDMYAPPSLAGSLPCLPEPASHPWHPQRFQDRCGRTSAAVHSYYDELPGLGFFRWLSLLNNSQLRTQDMECLRLISLAKLGLQVIRQLLLLDYSLETQQSVIAQVGLPVSYCGQTIMCAKFNSTRARQQKHGCQRSVSRWRQPLDFHHSSCHFFRFWSPVCLAPSLEYAVYIYMSDGSCARFLALYLSLQLLFGFLPWLDFFIQRGFLINSWKCQC